jgi:hypothetical protein
MPSCAPRAFLAASAYPGNRLAAQLVELLCAKGQTLWQIATRLNEAGYRTRREK